MPVCLARRRVAVCPQILDYVNFIRPWDKNAFSHPVEGGAALFEVWKGAYMRSGAVMPEYWSEQPRMLKPDGHTVSVSDMFFIAHHMHLCDTTLGAPASFAIDAQSPQRNIARRRDFNRVAWLERQHSNWHAGALRSNIRLYTTLSNSGRANVCTRAVHSMV